MKDQRIPSRARNDVCTGVQARIALRRDGDAVAEPLSTDEEHLAACVACAHFAAASRRLAPLFDAARELEQRPQIGLRLRAAIAQRAVTPTCAVWTMRAAASFVGFLTIFAVARALGNGARSDGASERVGPHTIDRFVGATRALAFENDATVFPETALLARFTAFEDQQ